MANHRRVIEVARFGGPEVLSGAQRPLGALEAGQVRVDIEAAGVNPADAYLIGGGYEFLHPHLPFVPGFDAAGVVTALGPAVDGLAVGDRVWVCTMPLRTTGTYADSIDCDQRAVHPLPDHLSFEQGAALGIPYITAHRALIQRGAAARAEIVLVHGASGGVGTAAVQLARSIGMRVIATASTVEGRTLLRQLGADFTLDHSAEGYLDAVDHITGGRGVDLIIEMMAGTNLEKDLSILGHRGRVVVVGSRTPITITPRLLLRRDLDVRGMALWNMTKAEITASLDEISRLLDSRALIPVVGQRLPLTDASVAHRTLVESGRSPGKVVLMTNPQRECAPIDPAVVLRPDHRL